MLGTFQDPTGFLYSYSDRKNYYIDVLTYWNTIIQTKKPNIVVFYTWPHTPSCYALYILAKYAYGIETLFIDLVPLLNQYCHLIQSSLEDLSYPLMLDIDNDEKNYNDNDKSEPISDELQKHTLTDNALLEKSTPLLNRLIGFSKNKFKLLIHRKISTNFDAENVDWKANKKPYDATNSRMNRLQFYLLFEKMKYKNKSLQKYYDKKTNIPKIDENFIYFPAPYQPEALSAMTGGGYENVLLTLAVLSNACPKDWTIYYKEHPSTFFEGLRGSLKRSKWFYDRLKMFENIKLIPSDFNQFELINNSKAVAIVTGTTAWEAVNRGKPVISFGQGYYSRLRGIIRVVSLQDAKDAIALIRSGFKPNSDDLSKYTAAIKRNAFKFPEYYYSSQNTYDQKRAELVADEFYKAHNKLYKSS